MFGSSRNPAQAYRQLDVETSLSSASPHRLIEMLFEGIDAQLARALAAISRKDIAEKGEALGRALRIVDEGLKAALDPSAGEISIRLRELYEYATIRLLEGNLHNDAAAVTEVRSLFAQLLDGWRGIADQVSSGVAEAA
ncbi:MAG: flagellar export chaperone FliS [Burkholderiaceae bacterium]